MTKNKALRSTKTSSKIFSSISNKTPLLRPLVQGLLVLSLSCGFSAPTLALPNFLGSIPASPLLPSLSPILKNAMPAVVNVAVQGGGSASEMAEEEDESEQQGPAGRPGQAKPKQHKQAGRTKRFQSIGSGVILDPENGIIVTNEHVIRQANLITVTLHDGRRLKAKLIGGDSETDVAVLKIDAKNLHTLAIGDSDKSEVGDFVVAIGNPFGLNSFGNSQTATFGMISATKRADLNIEGLENFIQTDAAINPGNSGGALVNTSGELIGINTAIISTYGGGSVGIGFAIPINMVKDVVQQLMQYGSIHRGLMGIFIQQLTPELAQAMGYSSDFQGALIAQVNPGSPAEQAGLKSGDIITKINGTVITQAPQVRSTIGLLRVGSEAQITVYRQNKETLIRAMVTDVKQHEQKMQASNPFLYGLGLKNFEQDSPIHGHVTGVQVVGASENSPGVRAGLQLGDVIIGANRIPTPTVQALQTITQQQGQKKGQPLLVQVLRGPGALFVLIL